MRTSIWIGATLATLLAVVGCDRVPTEPSPVPSQPLAAAAELERPPVATPPGLVVSVNWLAENRTRPNVVVLHVGTPATYNQGHVPGAWFVNLASLQSTQDGVASMLNPPHVLRSVLEAAGVTTSQHVIVTGDGPLRRPAASSSSSTSVTRASTCSMAAVRRGRRRSACRPSRPPQRGQAGW